MHRTVRGAAIAVVGNSWTITNTAPLPALEARHPHRPLTLTLTLTLPLTLPLTPIP